MPSPNRGKLTSKAQAQREAVRLVELWRRRLGLGEWTVNVKLAEKDEVDQEGAGVNANCNADPVYLRAWITFFPRWGRLPTTERRDTVIHELSHCISQEIRDLLNHARMGETVQVYQCREVAERLTQRIANAVQWK